MAFTGDQAQRQRGFEYTERLGRVLYGLGDFPEPNSETLELLEDYLRLRLGRWAQAATAEADAEAARAGFPPPQEVTPAALVAALQGNSRALAHCVTYHRLLADARRLAADNDDAAEPDGDDALAAAAAASSAAEDDGAENWAEQLPPFLAAAAAEASDALPRLQAERLRRMTRLSRCSEALSPADYARFAECRRCGLLGLSSSVGRALGAELARFRRWLGPPGARLGSRACRLLSYLGGQAVAELVDTVKQLRADTWPQAALAQFDHEVAASAAEMREAMRLRLR